MAVAVFAATLAGIMPVNLNCLDWGQSTDSSIEIVKSNESGNEQIRNDTLAVQGTENAARSAVVAMSNASGSSTILATPVEQNPNFTIVNAYPVFKSKTNLLYRNEQHDMKAIDLAQTLETLLDSEGEKMRLSVDSNLNAIIVAAKKNDLTRIEAMVEMLDRNSNQQKSVTAIPQTNCVIKVTWLVESEGVDENEAKVLREPNESLAELVNGLQKKGTLKDAKTLTELGTSVQVGVGAQQTIEFNNSSQRSFGGSLHSLHVKGQVGKFSVDFVFSC